MGEDGETIIVEVQNDEVSKISLMDSDGNVKKPTHDKLLKIIKEACTVENIFAKAKEMLKEKGTSLAKAKKMEFVRNLG